MKKEFVCIVCPNSCRLTVTQESDGSIVVTGNACKRGLDHGIHEFTAPMRMLTTTLAIRDAALPRLPVVSNGEIPKARMKECLDYLYSLEVQAPVRCGQVIVSDLCGTGVDICASRTMEKGV